MEMQLSKRILSLGCGLVLEVETAVNDIGTTRKIRQKKTQTNMRVLRGHCGAGAITALHCVTKKKSLGSGW